MCFNQHHDAKISRRALSMRNGIEYSDFSYGNVGTQKKDEASVF